MKIANDKVFLYLVNMFMQIIFVFFNIFFSIYIFDLSDNINFVLGYNTFQMVVILGVELVMLKLLTTKTFNLIYRSSFILALISIALVFTINKDTLYMVFVVQFIYSITLIFYYCPHEVASMNKNQSKQMKSFLGIQTLLGLVASFLSPFISGFIIDYISYYVLFGIILILAAICFILSLWIKNGYADQPSIKFKKFFRQVHKIKKIRYSYWAYGIYKFSQDSVYSIIIVLLLYMKAGTNFSVGIYSAFAALVGGVVLLLYIRFVKNKSLAMWVGTAILILSSIIIVAFANIIVFFVYYFLHNAVDKIISNGVYETCYCSINETEYQFYKKEHRLSASIYNQVLSILAYGIAFLVYNFVANIVALSLVLMILTFALILSTTFMIKSDKIQKQEQKPVFNT